MRTPKHFDESHRFTQYIYECAIRDRKTYIEAITPTFGEPDPETATIINETLAEIEAMKHRMRTAGKRSGA